MKLPAFLLLACASTSLCAAVTFRTPHLAYGTQPLKVAFNGATYINQGLVGTGRLSAQTVDFLGDTLGSFSSLGIDQHSWRRVGDHYEATLWTLPDRGLNDPNASLFYDYAARLHRFRIRLTPTVDAGASPSTASANQVDIVPDGGIELRDFRGRPFTGADPAQGTIVEHGVLLPSPGAAAIGAGKISIDAESLQFTRDGHFYVGDEYAAHVYYFDPRGHLLGVIVPPPAIVPRSHGKPDFNSLQPPETGRRNNQGIEGMSLSPDGRRLFVALQSALLQDSVKGDASGRGAIRVLVYDVTRQPTPRKPIGHYVLQLPSYSSNGDGSPADKTAAQSELRALNEHQFLLLPRDGNGLGTDNEKPIVYKAVILADIDGATNLAGSVYETGVASVLTRSDKPELKTGITPVPWIELVNLLNPDQLKHFGLTLDTKPKNQPFTLSEKWEAMDLAPVLDTKAPNDYFLFVGNDNDFIARHCVMTGKPCDSTFDNDNRLLVYRLTLPSMQRAATH